MNDIKTKKVATTTTNLNVSDNDPTAVKEVEVLYQRMGERWYAFSCVGDDVFFSPVPDEAIGSTEELPMNSETTPNVPDAEL